MLFRSDAIKGIEAMIATASGVIDASVLWGHVDLEVPLEESHREA